MQLLEHIQECEPKYDLWPYKRRNTGGSMTKNYRCVDLTVMHICTKFERNPSRNVACTAHTIFPPKYDLWPYKRRNTGGSITKNNRCVDFTKIHLHKKFERNLSRNAAVRAHTRMWRGGHGGGGVTLLNPKYPPAVPAGGGIQLYRSGSTVLIFFKSVNDNVNQLVRCSMSTKLAPVGFLCQSLFFCSSGFY